MSTPSKDNEKRAPAAADDSDWDDLLDDVLDDFSNMSTTSSAPPPKKEDKSKTSEKQVQQESSESLDDIFDQDEFAKQLAAGMEELMGHINEDKDMKDTFEKIWKSFEENESSSSPSSSSAAAGAGKETATPRQAQSFQDTIARTMNKLKDSSKQVDTSIAEEGQGEDAFMAEMMRQMESLAENGEFENVLEGMMQQLMSKDLLYEPMKDMAGRYPDWLKSNKEKLSKAEYEKYEKQYSLCKQVVEKYESPNFDEKNEAQTKEIMDLMQKMQDLGQPPASMLEEMAPGVNLNEGGIPEDLKDLENCNIM